jgi:plasmid stabilization system protein ParE
MNILITETAYRDIWSTAERLATLSAASSLAFIDGLEETLHLMARRFEREAGGATVAPEAIRYVTRGKYVAFYTVSETDLVVLHVSDSAAEIEMMLGDRTPSMPSRLQAARPIAPASGKPLRRPMAKT